MISLTYYNSLFKFKINIFKKQHLYNKQRGFAYWSKQKIIYLKISKLKDQIEK